MTVVSSKEFATNQDKYFELALDQQVFVKKGENIFMVALSNKHVHEDIIFQPDEDFYRSISADEFKERAREVVKAAYKRHKNERDISTKSA